MAGGSWTLSDLLEDLEQQAAGEELEVRDDEVSALSAAAYAEIDLADRLHGALAAGEDRDIDAALAQGDRLRGRLVRVGADFFVLDAGGTQWAVLNGAVATVAGLGDRALLPEARPLPARLGLRSLLRELADQWVECLLVLRGGSRIDGRVVRVGADFVELDTARDPLLVPIAALAAVGLR